MPPSSTLWPLEPHTLGKHLVLRSYLRAWLPIMASWNGRILFVDAFAGPGEYTGGEEGSPVIALRAYLDHRAQATMRGRVQFFFIEKELDRVEHLNQVIDPLRSRLPSPSHVRIVHGEFDSTMTGLLDLVDEQASRLAPSFVMVDPFGVKGTPLRVIERILRNPGAEVYISFMYDFIRRFHEAPEFGPHLDELFGTTEWRAGMGLTDPEEQRDFFVGLYDRQLRASGAQYVLHFDLYEGRRLVYTIFFATKHLLGCDKMKEAIWRVAPFGDFAFRPSTLGQLTLDVATADFAPLRRALLERYADGQWIDIEDVVNFVASDATPYYTRQLKTKVLKPMEREGLIRVDGRPGRRPGQYPEGTKIRFA